MILIDSLKGRWIPLDILLISNLWGSLECIQDVREQWHKHVICANLITQLLKLPTQRPSSLPWGPRSGPIEHLNIFYFISPVQIRCTVFSAHSTSTAHIWWRWAVLPFAVQTFSFRFRLYLLSGGLSSPTLWTNLW